jgi:hypothetical protein
MPGENKANAIPARGGERIRYYANGTRASRQIVFVNGIMNTPAEHALSCQQIMNATGCEVLGVYNQKGTENVIVSSALKAAFVFESLSFDLGQCINDQVGLLARGAVGYTGNSPNGCTTSLLNLLLNYGHSWPYSPLCIMAHSQGNLITSNALMQYSALMTGRATTTDPRLNALIARGPKKIHVFAVASPAMTWPTNSFISVHSYWHRYDPVTALSGGRNMRGTLMSNGTITSWGFGHSLDTYLDDKRLVDSVCRYMGTKGRYEVAPEKYSPAWSYI